MADKITITLDIDLKDLGTPKVKALLEQIEALKSAQKADKILEESLAETFPEEKPKPKPESTPQPFGGFPIDGQKLFNLLGKTAVSVLRDPAIQTAIQQRQPVPNESMLNISQASVQQSVPIQPDGSSQNGMNIFSEILNGLINSPARETSSNNIPSNGTPAPSSPSNRPNFGWLTQLQIPELKQSMIEQLEIVIGTMLSTQAPEVVTAFMSANTYLRNMDKALILLPVKVIMMSCFKNDLIVDNVVQELFLNFVGYLKTVPAQEIPNLLNIFFGSCM